MCARCLLQNGCVQCTLYTPCTLYVIHQVQQQTLDTFFCKIITSFKALRGSLRLLSFGSLQKCIAALSYHGRDCTQTYSQCCVCAETGAFDLLQAHLLPLPAAAAKPAITAKRPHHVVDSHSACHVGCWRRGCSAGGCCRYTCLGQPCRSSNSHSEHCCTARYAAQSKPMCVRACVCVCVFVCVRASYKLLGSFEGGNRYACGRYQGHVNLR